MGCCYCKLKCGCFEFIVDEKKSDAPHKEGVYDEDVESVAGETVTKKKQLVPVSLKRGSSFVMLDQSDLGSSVMVANENINPDDHMKALKWENQQLRREIVLSKAIGSRGTLEEDNEILTHGDVERLRAMFDSKDDQNDGQISYDNTSKLCKQLGLNYTEEELKAQSEFLDPDGDSLVQWYDFLFWWTETQQKEHAFKLVAAKLNDFDREKVHLSYTGEENTPEYRIYYEYQQKSGKLKSISPWHDIPLYEQEGICNFICEIPKWTRAKFEIAVDELHNPIKQDTKNGQLRSYKHGDMMFNYGALPQTWENPKHIPKDTGRIGDNDPLDVIEIGMTQLATGSVTPVKILGVIALIDDGETDWKVIAININDPIAHELNDIHDVEKKLPNATNVIRHFLRVYKVCTGKPENKFALGERFMNSEYAQKVIEETHEQWKELAESGEKTAEYGDGHNN